MSGTTKAGIAAILLVVAIATVCVYWTRTPQYALLRVLHSDSAHRKEQIAFPIDREGADNKGRRIQQRTEKLMHYLARLQNETLEQTYGVSVEKVRIEQKRAVLIVRLNKTIYTIPFYEEPDGYWKLAAFENRERLLREASERKKTSPVSIMAQL
jgi:hypothetical protein